MGRFMGEKTKGCPGLTSHPQPGRAPCPAGAGLGAAPASGRARAPPAGPSPAAAEASGSNLVSAPAQPGLHAELRPPWPPHPARERKEAAPAFKLRPYLLGFGKRSAFFQINQLPSYFFPGLCWARLLSNPFPGSSRAPRPYPIRSFPQIFPG